MHKIKAFVPHLFTLGNLFCGCMGIIYAFNWQLDWAAYMVFLAAFLDFFDGFFARILKVPSELGKQLDSLADMVSFGVVPGIVMFQWLKYLGWQHEINEGMGLWGYNRLIEVFPTPWYCYIALLIPLFSCYRLAKFNLDTRQSHGFIGLPTPANAIFFVSMAMIGSFFPLGAMRALEASSVLGEYISAEGGVKAGGPEAMWGYGTVAFKLIPVFSNQILMLVLVVVFSLLLVSEIPLFALKFKNFGWNDNKIRYIFLVVSAVLLICFWFTAIPFIVILYLLLSIINNLLKITV